MKLSKLILLSICLIWLVIPLYATSIEMIDQDGKTYTGRALNLSFDEKSKKFVDGIVGEVTKNSFVNFHIVEDISPEGYHVFSEQSFQKLDDDCPFKCKSVSFTGATITKITN